MISIFLPCAIVSSCVSRSHWEIQLWHHRPEILQKRKTVVTSIDLGPNASFKG